MKIVHRIGIGAWMLILLAAAQSPALAAEPRVPGALPKPNWAEQQRAYFTWLLDRLVTDIGPRPTGTASYERAARLVEREMRKSLKDVELQSFTFTDWELIDGADLTIGGRWIESYVYDNSPSTPEGGLEGVLVKQGSAFALEGPDGKIIARLAVSQYGRAIPMANKLEAGERVPIFGVGKQDADYLDRAAAERQPVKAIAVGREIPGATGFNVVGTIPGKTSKEILVLAHLDSVYNTPGAHDNAASAVVMVMLAHALAATQPQHTIRFVATGAEEIYYVGALDYAERRKKAGTLDDIAFVLNFDSLTYGPKLMISTLDAGLKSELEAIGREMSASEFIWPETTGHSLDEAVFWRAGARAVHFNSRGIDENLTYYHRPNDTADKVDPIVAYDACRMILEFIKRTDPK